MTIFKNQVGVNISANNEKNEGLDKDKSLNDNEKKIIDNPNMYTRNVELMSLIVPGSGFIYMGKKNKGIIYLIIFIIALLLFILKVKYGNWIVLSVYAIQFIDVTFSAQNQVSEIYNKIND